MLYRSFFYQYRYLDFSFFVLHEETYSPYPIPIQVTENLNRQWTLVLDHFHLPVSSVHFLHFALQAQKQHFLVQAACEPFFLHRLAAESSGRAILVKRWFTITWVCYNFRLLTVKLGHINMPNIHGAVERKVWLLHACGCTKGSDVLESAELTLNFI